MKLLLLWQKKGTNEDERLEGTLEFPKAVAELLDRRGTIEDILGDWEDSIGGPGLVYPIDEDENFIGFDLVEYDESEDLMPGKVPREIMADLELAIQGAMKDFNAAESQKPDPDGNMVIVYLSETDGDVVAVPLKRENIKEHIKKNNLHDIDYALIEGKLVKGFLDPEPAEFLPEREEG